MAVRVSLSAYEKKMEELTLVCIAWKMFCCRKALGMEIARLWQQLHHLRGSFLQTRVIVFLEGLVMRYWVAARCDGSQCGQGLEGRQAHPNYLGVLDSPSLD